MLPHEMNHVMAQFKEKHPTVQGLNIREMQKVLSGELVMVKQSKKFVLVTREDVIPTMRVMR